MDALIAWYHAHQAAVIQVLVWLGAGAQLFNSIVPASKGPAWLHDLIGRLALFDKEGHFTIPFLQGNDTHRDKLVTKTLAPLKEAVEASLKVFIPLFCMLFVTSCSYCNVAVNKNTAECKAYRVLTSCGEGAVALVLSALEQGTDVVAILEEVIAKFPSEYACVSGALGDQIAAKYGQSSPEWLRFHSASQLIMAKHSAGLK